MQNHPVVLATSDYYLPSEKGGGAVHALANMVFHLGEKLFFKIVTSDRDLDDPIAYPGLSNGRLYRVGKADVIYISPTRRIWMLLMTVRKCEFDLLYLNSFFSPVFTFPLLLFRKIGLIRSRPLVVAPRGEFSTGALQIKKIKKRIYIFFIKFFGFCTDVVWHVSTEHEEADVRRYFGSKAKVFIARDCLPEIENSRIEFPRLKKTDGQLSIVFLSRICRKKNLHGALSMLFYLKGDVLLRIYGHKEDKGYWLECQAIIDRLPTNIHVEYCGAVAHDAVLKVISSHHLFLLPTLGENFGYVILEALIAGCPILISDQTPWCNLQEKGIGWEVPLTNEGRFREVLQECINMNQADYLRLSLKARAYGMQIMLDDPSAEQSESLFRKVLE